MQLALESLAGDSPEISEVSFFLLDKTDRPALKLDALETGEFLLYVFPGELSAVPKDRLLNGYCRLVVIVCSGYVLLLLLLPPPSCRLGLYLDISLVVHGLITEALDKYGLLLVLG